MTSEVASLLEHDPVLKPSKRDGSPCLEPISESSLSTASSHSLLSDLEDCNYLVDEPPTSATTTDLNLEEKEPTSDPVRKPSKLRWGSVDGKSIVHQTEGKSRILSHFDDYLCIVRIFPIIPGDHPDCERGPPVSLAQDLFRHFGALVCLTVCVLRAAHNRLGPCRRDERLSRRIRRGAKRRSL